MRYANRVLGYPRDCGNHDTDSDYLRTAISSGAWLRLITMAVYRTFRRWQTIPPSLYIVLVLLATSELVSAQADFESYATSCTYRKAYAVMIKLLAVYTSHVVTIKVEPGLDLWATTTCYVTAALLPSSSALVSVRDLLYCSCIAEVASGFASRRKQRDNRNMQKAINAESVCIRVNKK